MIAPKVGIGTYTVSVLIGILLAIFCTAFLTIFTIRGALSENSISGMFDDLDIARLRVGRMLDLDGDAYRNNITLSEWIFSEMDDTFIRRYSMTVRDVENIATRLPLGRFVEDTLIRYGQGILQGNGNVNISSRDILNFVEWNEHHFYRELNIQLLPRDYDDIEQFLFDNNINSATRLDSLLDNVNLSVSTLRWGLSWPALILLLAVIIGLSEIVFFIFKKKVCPTLVCDGTALTVAGILFTVLIFSLNSLVVRFSPVELDGRLVDALLSGLRSVGTITGLVASGLGIALIAASVMLNFLQKRKS